MKRATRDVRLDLRFGRYQDALDDLVELDTLITDTPYSATTHNGHDSGTALGRVNEDKSRPGRPHARYCANRRRKLNYGHWTPADVDAFVELWAPRTRGWFLTLTDHVLVPAWLAALKRHGRYTFSPLACLDPGSRVRLVGDGPAQWAWWLVVARPRSVSYARWGSLPGGYTRPPGVKRERLAVIGGKPLWLMRSLVRDYSRPGDLVCDPCAGAGTTLRAAVVEGRRAVGAEPVRRNFELARRLLFGGAS